MLRSERASTFLPLEVYVFEHARLSAFLADANCHDVVADCCKVVVRKRCTEIDEGCVASTRVTDPGYSSFDGYNFSDVLSRFLRETTF